MLVAVIIGWPLVQSGRPAIPAPVFRASLAYFALIGFGFMFVQIPFLQRFSVFLGHPTYAFSIVLFFMILSAGLGSLVSERIDLGAAVLPPDSMVVGAGALVESVLLQPVIGSTVGWPLRGRGRLSSRHSSGRSRF